MSTKTSTAELQRMTQNELRQDIALHTAEYAKMRMGIGMQKEKNHALFKSKRREIARMKTVLTSMEKNQKKPMNPKIPTKPTQSLESSVSSVSLDSTKKPSQSDKKPVKVSRSK